MTTVFDRKGKTSLLMSSTIMSPKLNSKLSMGSGMSNRDRGESMKSPLGTTNEFGSRR